MNKMILCLIQGYIQINDVICLMMHNFKCLNSSLELFHYLFGQQSHFVCFLHFSPYKQFVFVAEKYFTIKT